MNRSTNAFSRRFRLNTVAACALSALVLAATGCSSTRTLRVTQEEYVNTGMSWRLPPENRTGDPLEVSVVWVLPEDLENPVNRDLRPESGITTKIWYERRPELGAQPGSGKFEIPAGQIFVLADQEGIYGTRLGCRLHGAHQKQKHTETLTYQFKVPSVFGDPIVYVFPKFVGEGGELLPVPPAVYTPPESRNNMFAVQIGVDAGRQNEPTAGQYIRKVNPE